MRKHLGTLLCGLSLGLLSTPQDASALYGCRVTLSGSKSFAQLQAAVNNLPATGGKVCFAKDTSVSNSASGAALLTITKPNVTFEAEEDALIANWSTSNLNHVITLDRASGFKMKNISVLTAGKSKSAVNIYPVTPDVVIENSRFYVYGDNGKGVYASGARNLSITDSFFHLAGSTFCGENCSWGDADGISVSGDGISGLRNNSFQQSDDGDTALNLNTSGKVNRIWNMKIYGRGKGIVGSRTSRIERIDGFTRNSTNAGTSIDLSYGASIGFIFGMKVIATNAHVVNLSYGATISSFYDSHLAARGTGSALYLSREGSIIGFFGKTPYAEARASLSSQSGSTVKVTYGGAIGSLSDTDITSTQSFGVRIERTNSRVGSISMFSIKSKLSPVSVSYGDPYVIERFTYGTLVPAECGSFRNRIELIASVAGCANN